MLIRLMIYLINSSSVHNVFPKCQENPQTFFSYSANRETDKQTITGQTFTPANVAEVISQQKQQVYKP